MSAMEIDPERDYGRVRRVPHETVNAEDYCSECGGLMVRHTPSCSQFTGKRRPFDPEAAMLAEAPVAMPQSTDLGTQSTELPAVSTEPPVVPEVMAPELPAAAASQAGSLDIEIDVPAGVSVRLRIKQGG